MANTSNDTRFEVLIEAVDLLLAEQQAAGQQREGGNAASRSDASQRIEALRKRLSVLTPA